MKRIFLFLSVALLVVAVSCKKEEEAKLADNDYRLSVLSKVSDLTTNTVTLSGHFEAGKNYKDAEHGIAVTGVINGSVQICKFPSEDSGDFSCEVTGMIPGSDYAFDAYAIIDEQFITTAKTTTDLPKFRTFTTVGWALYQEAQDLGTGVKWAPRNLGASDDTGIGYYYAFGETMHKTSFTKENFTPPTMVEGFWSWDRDYSHYVIECDAAHVALGGSWRVPTYNDYKNLIDFCSAKFVSVHGVRGLEFTGHSGKEGLASSIFLPETGIYGESGLGSSSKGFYQTSNLSPTDSKEIEDWNYTVISEDMFFDENATTYSMGKYFLGSHGVLKFTECWYGRPIRPVCDL